MTNTIKKALSILELRHDQARNNVHMLTLELERARLKLEDETETLDSLSLALEQLQKVSQ